MKQPTICTNIFCENYMKPTSDGHLLGEPEDRTYSGFSCYSCGSLKRAEWIGAHIEELQMLASKYHVNKQTHD